MVDDNEYKPTYTSTYPGFVKYNFSQPVSVHGQFYVGWRQYNEFLLNVGLDLNNKPVPAVMFYNLQGIWQSSTAPGVMMFRPFLYDESTNLPTTTAETASLHIYPNPATDRFFFEIPFDAAGRSIRIEIFDASGRLVEHAVTYSNSIDISTFPSGIYFVRALAGSRIYHSKLLINP